MNSNDLLPGGVRKSNAADNTSEAAQALFPLKDLQSLAPEDCARCQNMLGHGSAYGIWETSGALVEVLPEGRRFIDLRKRILASLADSFKGDRRLEALLDEGVLYLSRLGLLLRMGPAGFGTTAMNKPLDANTIRKTLYLHAPRIVARGIERRLSGASAAANGFACALSPQDQAEFSTQKRERVELKRLTTLTAKGLWADAVVAKNFSETVTPVQGEAVKRPNESKSVPYPPLPDEYMAVMGRRALWLIRDLGPNLVSFLSTFPALIGDRNFTNNAPIDRRIVRYFKNSVWCDRNGKPIEALPFPLRHNTLGYSKLGNWGDESEWPPRTYASIRVLAGALQRAHLWLAMLIMASRVGEVLVLKRDCVAEAKDGQVYVNGKTYKPTRLLGGREKESPPPQVLVFALAQQVNLVSACERLAMIDEDHENQEDPEPFGNHLWASLGVGSRADPTQRLTYASEALVYLARTLGMDTKPGGKNIHPHRLRKTIARLAGIAIDGAQKVLMQLLGHDDVTTTLLYMQSDPAFAKEIDDVVRELRVIRAEGLIADMHAALHDPTSLAFAGHGGAGARVLADAVRTREHELHQMGMEWGASTAHELAVILTNNGDSARLIAPHIICTKTPGEVGLCTQKRGLIDPGRCQVECKNHIEEAQGRRDVQRVVPILVEHAQKNIAEGNWLPAQSNQRQLMQELERYDDLGASFRALPGVKQVLEWKQ